MISALVRAAVSIAVMYKEFAANDSPGLSQTSTHGPWSELLEQGQGIPPERIAVIHNWAEGDAIQPLPPRTIPTGRVGA
jgi:hypothetical protein